MSKRRPSAPYDSSPPDELTDDDLPTEEHTIVDDVPEGVLTDDDIDDSVKTVERRLPPGLFEHKLPRFEMTGTITLPRDFAVVPEPVTIPLNQPPMVAVPHRVDPPPKPARPSLRSWATPPPKPTRPRVKSLEDSADFAPTPVRAFPDPGPPPLPPPAPRIPSVPPHLPPPARTVRAPSLPPPLPPPAAMPRPPSLPPPAARPPSLPPPAQRPPSLAPRPRMPSAPDHAPVYAEPPTPVYAEPPAPAPARPKKKKARPRPPEPAPLQAGDATRDAPLQAPRHEQPTTVDRYVAPRPEPSPSHTPPPLTASTPPPAFVREEPLRMAPQPHLQSEPPPRYPSAPPIARAGTSAVDQLLSQPPPPTGLFARFTSLPNSKMLSAAIGVFAALVVGMLVIMIATTLRGDPDESPAPSGPVVAARPLTTPARLPTAVATPARTTPAPPVPAVSPTQTSGPTPLGGCRLVTVPRRITGPAMANVLPMAAPAPGQSRVAVGFASNKNHAEGVIVNLDDLSVEPRYTEEFSGPVFRVTPLTDRAPVTFAVDRDDPRIQSLRTIPSSPPLRVGTSYFGFVRLNEATSPTVIWPGARFEGISEPAFAVTERDGHGIAFRTGRGSGDVLAGWLTPSGTADGDLGRIDAGAREVGAPSMAAGDKSVVVAFAARAAGEPWHIRVAVSPRGKVPTTSRELVPAQSGAADAISPVIVALSSGGFVLQWLEGSSGARRVMARTLDDRLTPQGLPIELAQGAGVQDAPGALVFRSGRVLAIHLAAADKSVELRGAVLVCG